MMTTREAMVPKRSGDPCGCAGCGGRLKVHKTEVRPVQGVRIRYLHCPECGNVPENNKVVVPLEFSRVPSIPRP